MSARKKQRQRIQQAVPAQQKLPAEVSEPVGNALINMFIGLLAVAIMAMIVIWMITWIG